MSDISDTLAPKSDQLDAVDLVAGPLTFTVDSVTVNKGADQPVSVRLREFPRVWRPGKNMRRVLGELWGNDSSQWTGRRVTLYYDKTVRFGGEAVGGTRISHMSHIDGPSSALIIPTRGKTAQWPVKPLENAPAPQQQPKVTEAHVAASSNEAQLREWWNAHPNLRPVIEARVAELKGAAETTGGE